jgi:hypothetical protein
MDNARRPIVAHNSGNADAAVEHHNVADAIDLAHVISSNDTAAGPTVPRFTAAGRSHRRCGSA